MMRKAISPLLAIKIFFIKKHLPIMNNYRNK
jgi:hypothetical protein